MPEAERAEKPEIIQWIEKNPYKGFTYKEYKKWNETRVELIDGLVYMMASPDEWHQWVSGELLNQLKDQLKGRICTPYGAPLDVRLFYEEDESDKTVIQPDIFVICDESKIKGLKFCKGAPDFIIEILSDFSRGRDFIDKKIKYEKAGVREYWIVSKDHVHRNILIDGVYQEKVYPITKSLTLEIDSLKDCKLSFGSVVERYQ